MRIYLESFAAVCTLFRALFFTRLVFGGDHLKLQINREKSITIIALKMRYNLKIDYIYHKVFNLFIFFLFKNFNE